jgi:hypothetical protein
MPQELPGKEGKIGLSASDFAGVRNIRFAMSSDNKTYASSSSAGHQRAVCGMKSGTVSFDLVLNSDQDIFDEIKIGDFVTLVIKEDATRDWSVPVIIDSMEEELQVEESEPLTVAVEASTHGAWTYPDGTVSS